MSSKFNARILLFFIPAASAPASNLLLRIATFIDHVGSGNDVTKSNAKRFDDADPSSDGMAKMLADALPLRNSLMAKPGLKLSTDDGSARDNRKTPCSAPDANNPDRFKAESLFTSNSMLMVTSDLLMTFSRSASISSPLLVKALAM